MNRREFLKSIGIGTGALVAGCATYDWTKPDANCTLYKDNGVSDGYLYDKVVNPCALKNGVILVIRGPVVFGFVEAEKVKAWAEEGYEMFAKDVTGEEFRDWASGLVDKINIVLGRVVAYIGRAIEVIPEDKLIKAGDKTVILYFIGEIIKAMDEMIKDINKAAKKGVVDSKVMVQELKF